MLHASKAFVQKKNPLYKPNYFKTDVYNKYIEPIFLTYNIFKILREKKMGFNKASNHCYCCCRNTLHVLVYYFFWHLEESRLKFILGYIE